MSGTPEAFHEVGLFNDLSYSKVAQILVDHGWVIWETIDSDVPGRTASDMLSAGEATNFHTLIRGPYLPRQNFRGLYIPLDPQTGVEDSHAWPSGSVESVYASLPPCNSPDVFCPSVEVQPKAFDLVNDIPIGTTGVQYTDGSNMVILARKVGMDRIVFSEYWYHTLDTSVGFKAFEKAVQMVMGALTGGISSIVIAAGNVAMGAPEPEKKPVNLTVPETAKEQLAPVDEVLSPIDPSPSQPIPNPLQNLPSEPEPSTITGKGDIPWGLILGAAAGLLLLN